MPKPTSNGLLFDPNASGKEYLSAYNHRGTRNRNKTIWDAAFVPQAEFDLFNLGDASGWFSPTGEMWCVHNGGLTKLGHMGERLSFCPKPDSPGVPWHGYPVSSASVDYELPEAILKLWESSGVVSKITSRKIRGGKL